MNGPIPLSTKALDVIADENWGLCKFADVLVRREDNREGAMWCLAQLHIVIIKVITFRIVDLASGSRSCSIRRTRTHIFDGCLYSPFFASTDTVIH